MHVYLHSGTMRLALARHLLTSPFTQRALLHSAATTTSWYKPTHFRGPSLKHARMHAVTTAISMLTHALSYQRTHSRVPSGIWRSNAILASLLATRTGRRHGLHEEGDHAITLFPTLQSLSRRVPLLVAWLSVHAPGSTPLAWRTAYNKQNI
jgi:hypothetical protein